MKDKPNWSKILIFCPVLAPNTMLEEVVLINILTNREINNYD